METLANLCFRVNEWWYDGVARCPDYRPRDRPMEVLALGVSRSGTDSMKQALEILGYDRVYHGFDCMISPEEMIFWRKAIHAKFYGGRKMTVDDWDQIFGHCGAVSDLPVILFARELIEAYPDAKVILSTRDVDSWYNSALTTVESQCSNSTQKILQSFHPLMCHYDQFYQSWKLFFRGSFVNNGKWVYEEYNAMIRGLVGKEEGRLLEYHVREGWEPICAFLGKEVPEGEVPNGNLGVDFAARCMKIQGEWQREARWNLLNFVGGLVVLVAVGGGLLVRGSPF